MPNIEISNDSNKGSKLDMACRKCKGSTKHLVLSEVNLKGKDNSEGYRTYYWYNDYQIVQCQGCELISFRETHQNSDEYTETDENGYENILYVKIYPNPEEGRIGLLEDHLLPTNLQRIYSETISAINGNQPVLTGIGVRAIVETICKDKNATGSTLFKQIDDLVTQGVLTRDGADILHKLRTLGNEAAHEVKPHDPVQLGLALDVIDHLLQGVYILPYHAKKKFK